MSARCPTPGPGPTPERGAPRRCYSRPMTVGHVHLGARDVAATRRFYEAHLGFRFAFEVQPGFVFLTDDRGFLLAISQESPAPYPEWFHVGFVQPSAEAVRALRRHLQDEGIPVDELVDRPERVAFGTRDPDGLGIEIMWGS